MSPFSINNPSVLPTGVAEKIRKSWNKEIGELETLTLSSLGSLEPTSLSLILLGCLGGAQDAHRPQCIHEP